MRQENRFITFLKTIWPTVYRIINTLFYLIIRLLKKFVILIIQQIKGQY
jgi:hypothetical protein